MNKFENKRDEKKTELDKITNLLRNRYIGIEPMLLIAVIAIIIVYYALFSSLGNNEDGRSSSIKVFVETILWLLFIGLILLNGITYIFDIDIIRSLKNTFGDHDFIKETPTDDSDGANNIIKFDLVEQVFNIPDNKYSFDDAKALCSAYNARLATNDEISEAYDKGADWCSYGWSEGQMALYPTQKDKWEKLQDQPGHERDCGRTGINGGYMDDATLKFGANCYGAKPSITSIEASNMRKKPIFNKNMSELSFDKKVDFWRSQLKQIEVAPFNHNNWSVL